VVEVERLVLRPRVRHQGDRMGDRLELVRAREVERGLAEGDVDAAGKAHLDVAAAVWARVSWASWFMAFDRTRREVSARPSKLRGRA